MTDTTASLQVQLDALRAAYRGGYLSCSYEGKQVTYRDMDSMMRAIQSLEAALGMTPVRVVTPRAQGGW